MLPWDTLISELTILSSFLPPVEPLWVSVSASQPAAPALAFLLRFLTFRLMFGFGRVKFVGSDTLGRDSLYNRNFFVNQPIPSKVAWYGYSQLPNFIHRASLGLLFVAEMVAPFLYFFTGWPRLVGCALTVILMVRVAGVVP